MFGKHVDDIHILGSSEVRPTRLYSQVSPGLTALGLQSSVLGGGKLLHTPGQAVKVFSKSTGQAAGRRMRADHAVTSRLRAGGPRCDGGGAAEAPAWLHLHRVDGGGLEGWQVVKPSISIYET